ncbi:MAG: argininosuccinate lyase, partial [Spirochaetia bacterium]|nr:argininosuccinate lyase [Spirochaetia bacterium]
TKLLSMNYRLFNAVLATLEVDEKTLTNRAYESFSVVTEMADQLYRAYQIPFRKAHHLVATLVKEAGKQNLNLKMLDESFFAEVYEQVMGKAFTLDFTPIRESLDPLAFVAKRDVEGGTSARAMQTMQDEAHQHLDDSVAWFGGIMAQQQAAEEKRKALIDQLLNT